MKYISYSSAGHHLKDPGAIGVNGRKESEEAMEFRNLVNEELRRLGKSVIQDDDRETLGQYLGRINPTDKDAVVEFHFNAFNKKVSGTESIVADDANQRSLDFGAEMSAGFAKIMGIPDRGVKRESQSARGRLGLMRKKGAVILHEIGFIDNPVDMAAYDRNKVNLACFAAKLIAKYDLN